MKVSLIKVGSFIGISAAIGYTVYNNVKKIREQKAREVIDIAVNVTDEKAE